MNFHSEHQVAESICVNTILNLSSMVVRLYLGMQTLYLPKFALLVGFLISSMTQNDYACSVTKTNCCPVLSYPFIPTRLFSQNRWQCRCRAPRCFPWTSGWESGGCVPVRTRRSSPRCTRRYSSPRSPLSPAPLSLNNSFTSTSG